MKVLIIAAHPDDEVLGMGGTITKYVKNGDSVKIIIMATGIFSRRSSNNMNASVYDVDDNILEKMSKQVQNLQKNAIKASKIMGVKDIEFLDFPDNEMDKKSNLEITKKIESIISKFKPDIVFTHSQHDVNIDHRMIYNATITATRPFSKFKVKEVISFEVPSSTEWYFPSKFSPNMFIDINKELTTKVKALSAYKTEINNFPHPRSAKGIEVIAKHWGTVSGFNAAEAFYIVRQLKTKI
jgi:LmbE family N-acetylglucosaminyl deacetylase|tara:strand:+ start:740 stop:1459 length:720 start_codon:yes stop_codon:yes gene_type:complete